MSHRQDWIKTPAKQRASLLAANLIKLLISGRNYTVQLGTVLHRDSIVFFFRGAPGSNPALKAAIWEMANTYLFS